MVGAMAAFAAMSLTLDQLFKFHIWMMLGLTLGLAGYAAGRDGENRT
jgi:hypothetical protein